MSTKKFAKKAFRKARAKAKKAARALLKALKKIKSAAKLAARKSKAATVATGQAIKTTAVAVGATVASGARLVSRGSVRAIGFIGFCATAAVHTVVSLVGWIMSSTFAVVVLATLGLLLGFTYGLRGLTYVNDWFKWLRAGRPKKFKRYHRQAKELRAYDAMHRKPTRVEQWLDKKAPKPQPDDEVIRYEAPVKVIHIDLKQAILAETGEDAESLAEAVQLVKDRLGGVTITEETVEAGTPVVVSVDGGTVQTIGEFVEGTPGRPRHQVFSDTPPPPDDEPDKPDYRTLVITEEDKEHIDKAHPLDLSLFPDLDKPREHDWAMYLDQREVSQAYEFFADRAMAQGDRHEASYWRARAFTRLNGAKYRWDANRVAGLFLSKADKRLIITKDAREGVVDECALTVEMRERLIKGSHPAHTQDRIPDDN